MLRNCRRTGLWLTLPAVVGMLTPSDANGFFGLFHHQQKQNAAAAMYGGTVCNPCGQQLVANYVPQTCYRAQCVTVPVTTYRPVTSCDPCTGCQTMCMKPTTCYQRQVQYVPYQSFRLQYSVAQPACPTTATTYYAATAATALAPAAVAAPATGCSSCQGATTAAFAAPSLTYAAPAAAPTTTYAYTYPSSNPGAAGAAVLSPPANSTIITTQPTQTVVASPIQPTIVAPSTPSPTITTPAIVSPSAGASTVVGPTIAPPAPVVASPTVVTDGGALVPLPSTFAPPTSTSGTSQSSQALRPTTPEASTPYSSGITTPVAPAPSATPSSTVPDSRPTPIPDALNNAAPLNNSEGPRLNPMSAPRLVDPQDKTAARSPTRTASFEVPAATSSLPQAVVPAAHGATHSGAIELGMPGSHASTSVSSRPVVDRDGWQASSR